jgi:hypothetical protein
MMEKMYTNSTDLALSPSHFWNVAVLCICFLCELMWLCCSPHQGIASPGARSLDRKRKAFCVLRCVISISTIFTPPSSSLSSQRNCHA